MATAVSTPPPDTTPKGPLTSSRDHVTRAEGWRRRGPLLPALIQCLSWDVALVWNTEPVPASPAAAYAETYVSIS